MTFQLNEAVAILSRTPLTLRALLLDMPDAWLNIREGNETWSPIEVLAHLIHADETNWLVRIKHLLKEGEAEVFPPFDRFAHIEKMQSKTIEQLLDEFATVREKSLASLEALNLTNADFEKLGQHPAFGQVKLQELLATWVVHDLSHIRQIVRTMAKQYENEVGPWKAYLSIFSGVT